MSFDLFFVGSACFLAGWLANRASKAIKALIEEHEEIRKELMKKKAE